MLRKAFLIACSSLIYSSLLHAEIVFDNIQTNYNGMYYPDSIEYGDEIQLGGSANILNQFQFEYFGEFGFNLSPSVKVRLYANDGKGASEAGEFAQPGTLLFESVPMPIHPGYNILTLRELSIPVTNNFTWTVQWEGLTGAFSNRAGIMFYNPPSVGKSYNDFWGKFPDGWFPMNFGGNPVANFAARVWASPDPSVMVLSATNLANGSRHITFQGPIYSGLALESSLNESEWASLAYFVMTNETCEFFDTSKLGTNTVQYRVRRLEQPMLKIINPSLTAEGQFRINFMCSPLKNFTIEAAMDAIHWTPMYTNYSSSVAGTVMDARAINFGRRYYRGSLLPDVPTILFLNTSNPRGTILNAMGPPGMDCVFQVSSNFKDWTSLSTNTFCYTGGLAVHVDPPSTNSQPRFYRIQSLPGTIQ
jgi:hypothetical protein